MERKSNTPSFQSPASSEDEESDDEPEDIASMLPSYPPGVIGDITLEREYAIIACNFWSAQVNKHVSMRLSTAAVTFSTAAAAVDATSNDQLATGDDTASTPPSLQRSLLLAGLPPYGTSSLVPSLQPDSARSLLRSFHALPETVPIPSSHPFASAARRLCLRV